MGVQSYYKAGAVGCLEWDCFDGQSYCPIPLPVGMQKGDQAGLQRMSILCSHKSVGSPWEQAGEGDAGARGMLEEAACSSHSACSALLAIKRLKELLHPRMRSSLSSHYLPHLQWLLLSVIALGSCSTIQ